MLNHGLLFQVYGEGAAWQFLGWILVFTCLVLANEFARRTKAGGMLCFVVLPIILTVYFIAIYVSAAPYNCNILVLHPDSIYQRFLTLLYFRGICDNQYLVIFSYIVNKRSPVRII